MIDRAQFALQVSLVAIAATVCTAAVESGAARSTPADLDALLRSERYVRAFVVGTGAVAATAAAEGIDGDLPLHLLAQLSKTARGGGDWVTSYQIATIAVEFARHREHVPPRLLARLLLDRGLASRIAGDRTLGATDFEEGLRLLDALETDDWPLRADLLQARANWTRRMDDVAAARGYEEALAARRRAGPPDLQTADTLVWLAHAYDTLHDRPDDTERALLEAREILHDVGREDHSLHSSILAVLSTLAVQRGDLEEGMRLRRECARRATLARARMFPGYARTRYPVGLELLELVTALDLNEPESQWASYVRAYRHGWQDHRRRWQAERLGLPVAEDLDRLEASRARSASDLRASFDPLRSPPGTISTEQAATFLRWLRDTADTLQGWQNLLDAMPATNELLELAAFQSSLGPQQAFLGLFQSHTEPGVPDARARWHAYGVLVRSTGHPVWLELDDETQRRTSLQVRTEVQRLMRRASSWPTRLSADEGLRARLRELHARWISPFAAQLEGTDEIILCAPELSVEIPFAALEAEDGQALIDRFALRHVISPQMVTQLASLPALDSEGRRAALVLGDPAYTRQHLEVAAADAAVLWSEGASGTTLVPRSVADGYEHGDLSVLDRLPRLPWSRLEAEAVAASQPAADLRLGPAANERALQELAADHSLGRYGTIHVASHALFNARVAQRCALALARVDDEGNTVTSTTRAIDDGLVDLTEIAATWQLDADLVTLSGCQTSVALGRNSQKSPGFVTTLLDVGARSVVSSQWKVDDAATALFMRRFYENLAGGQPKAQALRQAQRWLRDHRTQRGTRPFEHPVYWAAFFLTGDGR